MALIKCEECGKEVSDKAKACPNCGCPIASLNPAGTVNIKVCNGLAGTVKIFNVDTEELLWSGKAGTIATFEVSGITEIGISWGFHSNLKHANKYTVKGNEKYHLTFVKSFAKVSVTLNKIDVIDSE